MSVVAGEPASGDIFDGIDITWNRLPGGAAVGQILEEAARTFVPEQPEKTIPLLLKARPLIAAMKDPWAALKLKELDETIALCAGLYLDASTDRYAVVPGETLQVNFEATNRSRFPLALKSVKLEGMAGAPAQDFAPVTLAYNQPDRRSLRITIPPDQPYSQPYWLRKPSNGFTYVIEDQELVGLAETPPVLRARIRIQAGSEEIEFIRPVVRRYVDRVGGRDDPAAGGGAAGGGQHLRTGGDVPGREAEDRRGAAARQRAGACPANWRSRRRRAGASSRAPRHSRSRQRARRPRLSFTVTPPAGAARGQLRAIAKVAGREISSGMLVIEYPDNPPQTVFPPSTATLVRADVRTLAQKVGYVMGAGDEVPRALRQLGCEVTLLGAGGPGARRPQPLRRHRHRRAGVQRAAGPRRQPAAAAGLRAAGRHAGGAVHHGGRRSAALAGDRAVPAPDRSARA